jgi:hypothetical protein
MAAKNLYRGIFAFHVEKKKEYAQAYSLEQAKKLMVDKMAKKQGVDPKVIWNWMHDHPNSWTVKLEIEWTEVEGVE